MYLLPEKEIPGWMSEDELQWLFDASQDKKKVVEIGSWKGRSTHALLSGCKEGVVYAVDHFKGNPTELTTHHEEATRLDIHKIFLENVGHFPNLITLKTDSIQASKLFKNNSLDMVFIDGEHTKQAFQEDFESWLPKCKGLFCGHDANMEGPEWYLRENKIKFITKGQIWILCRE